MTKRRIAILILVFLSTFSIILASFFIEASNEQGGKYRLYYEVSFNARISTENLCGELKNSDGTRGQEVQIPVQTEVHIVGVKTPGYVKVETPIRIEIEGESQEVYLDQISLDYISMDNIDESSYAKELLQSKVQENKDKIDLKIRNDLIISVIVAVSLFFVFSWIFLFIEKKCTSNRKYKILFWGLLLTAILSLLFLCVLYDYLGHVR